jgi:hypothetical protein
MGTREEKFHTSSIHQTDFGFRKGSMEGGTSQDFPKLGEQLGLGVEVPS